MADATDVAIAAGVIVTGTTLIRNAHEGKSKAAPIIFGFMMTALLLLIALGSPKIAKGLSYFAMVGAFAVNGPVVFSIARGLGPTPAGTHPPVSGSTSSAHYTLTPGGYYGRGA